MIISIIGFVALLMWARAFHGSMKAFEQGEAFLAEKDPIRAVSYFDRSLHWYAPFSPYVGRSAERLWEISQQAETNGDMRLAIIAVDTLRRGYIAARSWWVPGRDWIERCDARLKSLSLLQQTGSEETPQADRAKGSILDDPQVKGPHVLWSLVVVVGFLGWVGSAIALIISARGQQEGIWRWGLSRIRWVGAFAISWIVWIVGMVKA